MTNKLYYSSPYKAEWKTKIKESFEKEDQYFVILDETAFYPAGGGQPYDTGTINGIEVLDVLLEDNEIVHKVANKLESSDVTCVLDWQRRFDHMQHHSGQHLLSAVCYSLYEARTVSFHLGQDYATIDIDIPELSQTQIENIEKVANKEIYNNRKIQSYFVTDEELKDIPLLKMPKVTEGIRIVEIEGIEHNACGGTHVSRTGEIGLIKLFKTEKQKGYVRIYFKCGTRALQEFNESLNILNKVSAKFNTGKSEIMDRLEKWELEQKKLEAENTVLKEKNNMYLANELLSRTNNDFLIHIFEDKPFNDMKELAIHLANENDLFILFATTTENKIVLVHNGTKTTSCGKFLKEHLASFNGKGGGNDKTAQAGFSSSEDTLQFFKFVSQELSKN